jgi:hypothetical protein
MDADDPRFLEKENTEGCDILSIPPSGGDPHPVEVKGWGDSLIGARGRFTWTQEIQPSQMQSAQKNDNYRLEIVANLRAYHAGAGLPERLTLDAAFIREHAVVSQYRITLDPLKPLIADVEPEVLFERAQQAPIASHSTT